MTKPRHILLCGERGVGKSTLIARLLRCGGLPVYGFVTELLAEANGDGLHEIHIYPVGGCACVPTAENLVGVSGGGKPRAFPAAFDTLGVRYLQAARPGGLIGMDELGFLEARADRFTGAVLAALDGDIPVLAAVKARGESPFLRAVRGHGNAALYRVDEHSRDSLFDTLCPVVSAWGAED